MLFYRHNNNVKQLYKKHNRSIFSFTSDDHLSIKFVSERELWMGLHPFIHPTHITLRLPHCVSQTHKSPVLLELLNMSIAHIRSELKAICCPVNITDCGERDIEKEGDRQNER